MTNKSESRCGFAFCPRNFDAETLACAFEGMLTGDTNNFVHLYNRMKDGKELCLIWQEIIVKHQSEVEALFEKIRARQQANEQLIRSGTQVVKRKKK